MTTPRTTTKPTEISPTNPRKLGQPVHYWSSQRMNVLCRAAGGWRTMIEAAVDGKLSSSHVPGEVTCKRCLSKLAGLEIRIEATRARIRAQHAAKTPRAYTVHDVLAGAYNAGRNPSREQLARGLTHASYDGGETSACGRVKAGSLCDQVEPGEPTCPRCVRIAGKVAQAGRAAAGDVAAVMRAVEQVGLSDEVRSVRAALDAFERADTAAQIREAIDALADAGKALQIAALQARAEVRS